MSRLPRFDEYRYVGARDTMRVYDCDDPNELETLQDLVRSRDLLGRKLLQAFAPDTLDEARNRGFKPVR